MRSPYFDFRFKDLSTSKSPAGGPDRLIRRFAVVAFAGGTLFILLARFLYGDGLYLSFFADDFFYYLKIAQNLVDHGRSSFDLISDTNGYHPLWMLLVALAYAMFGTGKALFIVLTLIIYALSMAFLFFAARIARRYGAPPNLSVAAAIYATLFMLALSRTGMEVSLALTGLAALSDRMLQKPLAGQGPRALFVTGLIAAFCCLARLDAVLFPAILFAVSLASMRPRNAGLLLKALALGAGMAPILVYVAINLVAFDVLMPVSAMAKQLKQGFSLSIIAVERLAAYDPFNLVFVWPTLGVGAAYAFVRWREHHGLGLSERNLLIAAFAHAGLMFLLLSALSDWPIWTWYLYVFVMPLLFSVSAAFSLPAIPEQLSPLGRAALAIVLALTVLLGIGAARINMGGYHILAAARQIADFARSHPGRYAMGDRAGMPGYLLKEPLLQLEGLVADRALLASIARGEPLDQVLRARGIRYYVASTPRKEGGCYVAREPSQAGPSSPVMTAQFCAPPLMDFPSGEHHTLIFAVPGPADRS